jgi:hypothetical protein
VLDNKSSPLPQQPNLSVVEAKDLFHNLRDLHHVGPYLSLDKRIHIVDHTRFEFRRVGYLIIPETQLVSFNNNLYRSMFAVELVSSTRGQGVQGTQHPLQLSIGGFSILKEFR